MKNKYANTNSKNRNYNPIILKNIYRLIHNHLNNKLNLPGIWSNFYPHTNNQLLTKELIKDNLNSFWLKVMNKLNKDQYILFLFRIHFENDIYITLNNIQKFNKTDFKELLDSYCKSVNTKNEKYLSLKISRIIFTYKIIPMNKLIITKSNITFSNKKLSIYKIFGYILSTITYYTNWSDLNMKSKNIKLLQRSKDLIYHNSLIFYNNLNFINFSSVIFLGIILYNFFIGLELNQELFGMIFTFVISYLFSSYILNKFTFSKNIIIRLFQKFILLILFLIFSFTLLYSLVIIKTIIKFVFLY